MDRRQSFILTGGLAVVALLVVVAVAVSYFDLVRHVIAGGGGYCSSADYALDGTVGQPAVGELSCASHRLRAGYLFEIIATPTPTPTPTSIPTKTPIPPQEEGVFVFDNAEQHWDDLTGQTDLDPADSRNLTIYWNASEGAATDWHIYVRKRLGGVKYVGHTKSGSDTSLDWYPQAPNLGSEFEDGPDFNSAYTFRVIRIDEDLGSDDYLDQAGVVGFNLEGGNPVSLSRPAMPNLETPTASPNVQTPRICIYDDILGGNDLAPTGSIGSDTDDPTWRAIQIAWNFGIDPTTVNQYHVQVSVNNGPFEYLGQTGSSNITYFWWTSKNEFMTAPDFADGPQGGENYQFRAVVIPLSGLPQDFQTLISGKLMYSVSQDSGQSFIQTQNVLVYDNASDTTGDLTGQTDFDPVDGRNLTIHWNAAQGAATDWHIYVRKGLGGMKYLGHTMSGSATSLDWSPEAPGLGAEFRNGPDFNSAYTFRVIRLDGDLAPGDYFDPAAPVGFNLEGGNPVSLSQPAMPNLNAGQICIYDDILGGNDLAPTGGIGSDTDDSSWRAIQIAWNFDVDRPTVNMYHVQVSIDGGDFEYLGQTGSGDITYFWWTSINEFETAAGFADGPEGGRNYQFRVILFPLSGPKDTLTSGTLMYSVADE